MHFLIINLNRSTDPEEESARTAEQEKSKEGEGVEGTISLDSWDDFEGYYMPTTGQFHTLKSIRISNGNLNSLLL
jgi:hypothetical protein